VFSACRRFGTHARTTVRGDNDATPEIAKPADAVLCVAATDIKALPVVSFLFSFSFFFFYRRIRLFYFIISSLARTIGGILILGDAVPGSGNPDDFRPSAARPTAVVIRSSQKNRPIPPRSSVLTRTGRWRGIIFFLTRIRSEAVNGNYNICAPDNYLTRVFVDVLVYMCMVFFRAFFIINTVKEVGAVRSSDLKIKLKKPLTVHT